MSKIDLTSLTLEEAEAALGMKFTKQQRETFEKNVKEAAEKEARKTALETLERKLSKIEGESTDERKARKLAMYETLVSFAEIVAESFETTEGNKGRGRVRSQMVMIPLPNGSNFRCEVSKTL